MAVHHLLDALEGRVDILCSAFKTITSLETAMVHKQCTRSAFFNFFYLRGDATGKLAGIWKNVNDESC